jgi:hypothetical protein
VPLHWKGAQTVDAPGTQAPLPSQLDTALRTAMEQLAAAHWVPAW